MKKSIFLLFLAGLLVTPSVFANMDSPASICNADADEINFESPADRDSYISDCVEQIKQDAGEMEAVGEAPEGSEVPEISANMDER
ncbi:MAG: hypothetical protein OEX19_14015 [Gammaproteobacteria bacterium]|nr:hypothetical protein [Gammaproteobacteria bacterium]